MNPGPTTRPLADELGAKQIGDGVRIPDSNRGIGPCGPLWCVTGCARRCQEATTNCTFTKEAMSASPLASRLIGESPGHEPWHKRCSISHRDRKSTRLNSSHDNLSYA